MLIFVKSETGRRREVPRPSAHTTYSIFIHSLPVRYCSQCSGGRRRQNGRCLRCATALAVVGRWGCWYLLSHPTPLPNPSHFSLSASRQPRHREQCLSPLFHPTACLLVRLSPCRLHLLFHPPPPFVFIHASFPASWPFLFPSGVGLFVLSA